MRYVIGIGGNALTDYRVMGRVAECIANLAAGTEIAITHGNGPRVGELAMVEKRSFAVLTAQTQAEIGIEVERSIEAAMKPGRSRGVAVVLTRVTVDKWDREFKYPTKPIGDFCTKDEAMRLKRKGFIMRKLIHGYRRVVPSPKPKRIVESGLIHNLLSKGYVVVAAGGGGIAVTANGRKMQYADAVIDKDFASSLLAESIHADRLLLLTNVDGAFLNFGTKRQKLIGKIDVNSLEGYSAAGQFEQGSMLPKVKACIEFVRRTGKVAVIGNLKSPEKAFRLNGATVVVPS